MFKKLMSVSALALVLAGCDHNCKPDTAYAPGSYEDFKAHSNDRVFFALNSAELVPEAMADLDVQKMWLWNNKDAYVMIEGHCDQRGTSEYNYGLGERRATTVKNYLMAMGIPGDRIKTISYGKERPAVEGHNEAAWAQNRRAVTMVVTR